MSDFIFSTKFRTIESKSSGVQAIELLEDSFDGIIFSYGKVTIGEDGDTAKLGFEYEILDDNGIDYNQQELEAVLGDLLVELIMSQLASNSVVYTGGVDSDDTTNYIE